MGNGWIYNNSFCKNFFAHIQESVSYPKWEMGDMEILLKKSNLLLCLYKSRVHKGINEP